MSTMLVGQSRVCNNENMRSYMTSTHIPCSSKMTQHKREVYKAVSIREKSPHGIAEPEKLP